MDTAVKPASEIEQLVSLVDAENPFDIAHADMLPRQLAAIDELFKDRIEKIKLLQHRAETGGIKGIGKMADVVPLLFAHTAYKSYPESWLVEQKWDRMAKWLDTVSTHRVKPMDTGGVTGLDDWLQRLEVQGHYVSCSSGTTGKCAMMNSATADLDFHAHALARGIIWGGLSPTRDRRMFGLGQMAANARNKASGKETREAFTPPGSAPFAPDVPPITIGGVTEMIFLRKKIADGTAKPSEIAHFEAQQAVREKAMESAAEQTVDALIASRHTKLYLTGMYPAMYKIAEGVRAKGFSGKDFQENVGFITGGLKRAQLPPNYRAFIFETFNLSEDRVCSAYGMQELNTLAHRCKHGRYHMPPWLMLLLLDESGDHLIEPPEKGEAQGRAAFFDLSLDGRWGGIITGDKVRATWEACTCGNRSPSIADDIQRYADTADGDKIACAGTIDAYVRGIT